MNFSSWLRRLLARHPLREPANVDRSRYTAQVMAKIRVLQEPSRAPAHRGSRWWPLIWALPLTAMATLLIARVPHQVQQVRLIRQVRDEVQLLAALGETPPVSMKSSDPEELAEELETARTMMLAEDVASDDSWVGQTLQLLNTLDEDVSTDSSRHNADEDDWLDEFQMLESETPPASS